MLLCAIIYCPPSYSVVWRTWSSGSWSYFLPHLTIFQMMSTSTSTTKQFGLLISSEHLQPILATLSHRPILGLFFTWKYFLYFWQHKLKYPRSQPSSYSLSSLIFLFPLHFWSLILLKALPLHLYLLTICSLLFLISLIWFGEILLSPFFSCLCEDFLSCKYINHHLSLYMNISCIPTSSHGS